jgi:hypothetical protein
MLLDIGEAGANRTDGELDGGEPREVGDPLLDDAALREAPDK